VPALPPAPALPPPPWPALPLPSFVVPPLQPSSATTVKSAAFLQIRTSVMFRTSSAERRSWAAIVLHAICGAASGLSLHGRGQIGRAGELKRNVQIDAERRGGRDGERAGC